MTRRKLSFSAKLMSNEKVRYVALGCISTLLNLFVITLLIELFSVSDNWAAASSYLVVALFNFALARYFVFQSHAGVKGEILRYSVSQLGFRFFEFLLFTVVNFMLPGFYWLSVIFVAVVAFGLKYFVYKSFVFGREKMGNL